MATRTELMNKVAVVIDQEKEARARSNLAVVAAARAKHSILREQIADIDVKTDNLHANTIELDDDPDDSNLKVLVSKREDSLSVLYGERGGGGGGGGEGKVSALSQSSSELDDLVKLSGATLTKENLSPNSPPHAET